MTALIPKSKFTPELAAAIELYRQAMAEHRSGPAPSADAIVQAAVRRVPGRQLTEAEAMAVVEKHVAQAALPMAQRVLAQLKASPPGPPRKTLGLWAKKTAVVDADKAKKAHEAAIAQLELSIVTLRNGKVPPMFQHLMPPVAPLLHDGPDRFEVDYEIIDDAT